MSRGVLTDELQWRATGLMQRPITVAELRLMPYIQYVMVNDQRIEPDKCNLEDRQILSKWREEGRIDGGAGGLYITQAFWNIINEIIWHSYVASQDGELK